MTKQEDFQFTIEAGEGVPYPTLVFAAMLPWTFFATAFADVI